MLRLALLLTLAAAPAAAQSFTQSHTGTWIGEGTQTDGQRWQMLLILRADGAIVDYPDFPCSAFWRFDAITETTATGSEHLVAGFEDCTNDLSLSLRDDGKGALLVTWSETGVTPDATATLSRQ
ncbi:hypothetical protein [Pararhodobacter zhoushanensis]|uniref:hypothetical protein n=1 Tax=Pararhodobacter zhoushanensis TaxID=2479545 RepID=UPI000F8E2646|nr:hypothetical protein [Pararhodobacter zhoushanensis]